MNTRTFSGDEKFDEVGSVSRAIDLLDIYDPCSFIDAMQTAKLTKTFRPRYGLPLDNDEAFWNEVVSSLQSCAPARRP